MGTAIRVLCVDDSPDLARLYAAIIDTQPDMCCVGVRHDAANLVDEAERTQASVILLDLSMPGGPDPLSMIRAMVEAKARARVLVFSGHDDDSTVETVLDAGAWGLASKNGDRADVLQAIRRVASGEVSLPR